MFEFIRSHQRLTLGFMLLLIIPSFVVFGIEGYSRFSSAGNVTVARVAGQSVTRAEWDQAHDRLVNRLRSQQALPDTSALNTPQARLDTLDAVLRERVLLRAASDLHLFPPPARMGRLFDGDPQYAGLRGPDGRLSRDMLASMGMTPELFDQRLAQEYAMRQVLAGVALSTLAPAGIAGQSLDALLQRREVQMQRFDIGAYRAKVKPGDADVEAYYKANESLFRAPEQAQIEYVVLDLETLGRGVAITDEDLRKFYEAESARFSVPEERRASHILIQAGADIGSAERAQARAKAEALLKQVRDKPSSFAELARKNSQDPGSAAQGGDLDYSRRGAMVKAFEDALFALKPGEISDVVQTEFGYHIIMLTAVRGGQKKPFDEVRAEIQAELRKAQASKRWPESAEQFTNMAYEQSDSLQPLVDKFKLDKKTATVQRTPAPGASGALASGKLLEALFSTDALRNKRNTDAIEVGPNQLVAARVVQHQPSRVLPLAEVRERVVERLVATQAAALARKDGEARLAALKAAPDEALPETLIVSRLQTQGAPPQVMEAVMRADPARLPHVEGVDLGQAGYAVLRVKQVLPRAAPAGGSDEQLRLQYGQAWAAAEADAYLGALKKRYKVEVTPEAVTAAAAAAASAAGF